MSFICYNDRENTKEITLTGHGDDMKPTSLYQLIIASLALLVVLACNALVPVPTAVPSPLPPTLTSVPSSQPFVVSTLHFDETGQNPDYTVDAQFPAILDNNDPRALAFNNKMQTLVQSEIGAFKNGVIELPIDPNFAASFFEVTYTLLLQKDDILSLKYDFSGYISGAAHPYHYSMTVNYDFSQSHSLSLDELFFPGSNYLEAISNYCIAELSKRDIAFDMFSEGAKPTSENYRNWNITADGLVITFDEYQVAPYAAGPQTVIVPYSELQASIDPQGPLGIVIQ